MKSTTTLAGLSLLLLAGCSSAVTIRAATCGTGDLTLRYGEGQLALDKGCVEARAGTSVTLNLRPTSSGEASQVTTKFVGLGKTWLKKVDEDGEGAIVLEIPADEDRETLKYVIKVRGVGKLDPRIVVQ
jgi:hypothetical protein